MLTYEQIQKLGPGTVFFTAIIPAATQATFPDPYGENASGR